MRKMGVCEVSLFAANVPQVYDVCLLLFRCGSPSSREFARSLAQGASEVTGPRKDQAAPSQPLGSLISSSSMPRPTSMVFWTATIKMKRTTGYWCTTSCHCRGQSMLLTKLLSQRAPCQQSAIHQQEMSVGAFVLLKESLLAPWTTSW